MDIFADLLLIGVILIFVISGMKRGFTRTLLSFAARIISVVVAAFLSKNFAPIVYNSYLQEGVLKSIKTQLDANFTTTLSDQIAAVTESIPTSLLKISEMFGVNTATFEEQIANADISGDIALALEQNIAAPIILLICRIIIFVIISTLASFVLGFIVNAVCKVVSLPVLRTANKILGAALGLINGVICALIISYVCVIVSGLIDNSEFSQFVLSSQLIKVFTNISLFI